MATSHPIQIYTRLTDATTRQDAYFIDAPISGGQAGAENGTLTIMCGGVEAAFQRAESSMQTYQAAGIKAVEG